MRLTPLAVGGLLLIGCSDPRDRFTYDQGAVIRGDRSQRELALIFTGGEHGQATGMILEILAEHDIPAAFFVTGDYLAVPEQRALVPRMLADGHYVGPHSHAHLLYCAWEDRSRTLVTEAEFAADLRRNVADLRELGCFAGGRAIYFVPPYEWYNAEQVAWAAKLGARLINFTPGSGSNRDWIPESDARFQSSREIVAGVLEYEARQPDGLNGFVLLLHLGSTRADRMDGEVADLLTALRERGYRFRRVDRLLAAACE
jgi:peptidoglycan/xylan/chitin deacetylase (PgdA/CDA1 family)